MNKPIQLHLLSVIDPPVNIYFKEELHAVIPAFINHQAVRTRFCEGKVLPKVSQQQMTAVPGSACRRNHRLAVVKGDAVVVSKYI